MSKKRKASPPQKQDSTPPARPGQGRQVQAQITAQHYSGPVPPPEILRGYDQVIPGAAERILEMAEADQRHTHEMEARAQKRVFAERKRGQIFALVVSLGAFTAAAVMSYFGAEKAAMVLSGSTIVGLVSAFITGRRKSSEK